MVSRFRGGRRAVHAAGTNKPVNGIAGHTSGVVVCWAAEVQWLGVRPGSICGGL